MLTRSQNHPCTAQPDASGVDDVAQAQGSGFRVQGLGLRAQAWLGLAWLGWVRASTRRTSKPALRPFHLRDLDAHLVRALTGTSPHLYKPSHVQALACAGSGMYRRSGVLAFRRRPSALAVPRGQWVSTAGALLGSAGAVLAAWRRWNALGELGCAWMRLDELG